MSLENHVYYNCISQRGSKRKSAKSELCYDRQSVGSLSWSWSVLIWGTRPDFCYVKQLRVCWCWAPTMTKGRLCRLQPLLVLASAVVLLSESRETHDYILLSQIRYFPNLEGQVPVFISPRNRVAQLYPQALGSLLVTSYDSQGYGGGIRTRLHAGKSVSFSEYYINVQFISHRKHITSPL
jgi:hypothetical protein